MNFELRSSLNAEHYLQAAALVYDVFPTYYALFSHQRGDVEKAIARQFGQYSELNSLLAAFYQNEVIGLISYYPTSEFEPRRMASTKDMLQIATNRATALAGLRDLSQQMPSIRDEGIYLPRVSVHKDWQGKGVSKTLMDALIENSKGLGLNRLFLHVKRDNARARGFYQKMGFRDLNTDYYAVMALEF